MREMNDLADENRLDRLGGVYPIGSSTGIVSVDGRDWELFVGYNGAMKVFSFVAHSRRKYLNSDVKNFFNHITNTQGFPARSQYLLSKRSCTGCFGFSC